MTTGTKITMNDGSKGMLVIANDKIYAIPEWRYTRTHVSKYEEALAKIFAAGWTRVYRYNFTKGIHHTWCDSPSELIKFVNNEQL